MSPPDSRLQSPEVPDNIKTNRMDPDTDKYNVAAGSAATAPVPVPQRNEDRHRSWEENTPETGLGSAFLSQSLASVDSEGSWLSGKPLRRTSHPLGQPMRSSTPSSKDRLDEFSEAKKAENNAGDEYYNKMTPDPEDNSPHHRQTSSGEISTESDRDSEILKQHTVDEDEHRTFHKSVAAKNPVLVRPGGARPKSKEGLLNDFKASQAELTYPEEEEMESPGESPVEGEAATEIHRATSVDLGKRHVRHISAGSAKLLNLPRRDSVDSRRQSSGSYAPVPGVNADTVQE